MLRLAITSLTCLTLLGCAILEPQRKATALELKETMVLSKERDAAFQGIPYSLRKAEDPQVIDDTRKDLIILEKGNKIEVLAIRAIRPKTTGWSVYYAIGRTIPNNSEIPIDFYYYLGHTGPPWFDLPW